MTKLPSSIHLKGIRDVNASFSSKVWLNHKPLKLEKSLKVKTHTLSGFNWGKHEKGAAQLALAICMEIYPPELVLKIYPEFRSAILASIQEDNFSYDISLTAFNDTCVGQQMRLLA